MPPRPRVQYQVAVDLVVLTVLDEQLQVLVVTRGKPPFKGRRSLPGGFMRPDEDLPDTAVRELGEETGLDGGQLHLEQLGTYATPGRDPRGLVASVAYLAIAPDLPTPQAGTDAAEAHWQPARDFESGSATLAFDHDMILRHGLERARAKLEYTPLATAFCKERFTIAELRRVYEIVWGTKLDPRNFHRKVTGAEGFLTPTDEHSATSGRPATLYRKGIAAVLHPAMLPPPTRN